MYYPKLLIEHLDFYLSELNTLILDETKKSFSEQHKKEHGLIEGYINSLKNLNEDFHVRAEHIKNGLSLIAHPEGGFYREFIRTNDQTVIFYLLPKKTVSSWHSLKDTKEEFKLILGEPLIIEKIGVDGIWKSTEEVKNKENVIIEKNESGEFGDWFGAHINGAYGLVTCKCTGPFEFEKFKIAKKEDLDKFHEKNPGYTNIIDKLTPKDLREQTNGIQSIVKFFTCCCSCIGVKKIEDQEQTSLLYSSKNNR
jgi:uncharacterized protein